MHSLKVSIVIVNYNVKELLLTCLRSFYKFHKNTEHYEVIIVDNQSVDGSVEAIKAEFPEVIIIRNNENAGFPKANNQGFEIAKGEFIFMLNPDTEFIENSIDKLVSYMDENIDISLVGPALLNTDNSHQKSVWRYPSISSIFCEMHYLSFLLKKKNYEDQDLSKSFDAESFSGAAIFFRTSVLKNIGNLDETMFWIEDVEFCYRAHQKGLRNVYFPATRIKHHIGQSAKKNYNISISNQIFNKIKFFRKHHSNLESGLVVWMSFINVIQKIIVFGILSPFKSIYYRKAKAYLYTLPKVFNPPKGIA